MHVMDRNGEIILFLIFVNRRTIGHGVVFVGAIGSRLAA